MSEPGKAMGYATATGWVILLPGLAIACRIFGGHNGEPIRHDYTVPIDTWKAVLEHTEPTEWQDIPLAVREQSWQMIEAEEARRANVLETE